MKMHGPKNKINNNPSSGSRVPCGQTDGRSYRRTDWQTDITELIVAFHNFADPPS